MTADTSRLLRLAQVVHAREVLDKLLVDARHACPEADAIVLTRLPGGLWRYQQLAEATAPVTAHRPEHERRDTVRVFAALADEALQQLSGISLSGVPGVEKIVGSTYVRVTSLAGRVEPRDRHDAVAAATAPLAELVAALS